MQNALTEINADATAEASTAIDDAKHAISEYRATVDGV